MELLSIKCLSDQNRKAFFEENGYTNLRIPGIVHLHDGTLICCCECRRGGDWSAIDIGMQKSTDDGKTWSQTRILISGKGRNTMNNPVMIADGSTLWLLFCENYKRVFITKSEDSGETFCEPTELTHTIECLTQKTFWSVLAVGPGHGIALPDGNLLIPVWFGQNRKDIFSHHPSVICVLKRNGIDGMWSLSAEIGTGLLKDPSECCIARCADGRLVLNIRNENDVRLRAVSFSKDAGSSWSAPVFEPRLPDPVCCAGMCAYGKELLFTNCASQLLREKLTLKRIAADGNISETLLISESGGYSDICCDEKNGKAYVVFENGSGKLLIAEIQL